MFNRRPKTQLSDSSAVETLDPHSQAMLEAKAGDIKAFSRIYDAFKGPLMSYVYGFTSDRNQAEDLVQEIFLKAYRARDSYEPKAKLSTWLWTIARNTCIDQLRKGSNKEFTVGAPDEDDPHSIDLEQIEAPLPDAEALLMEQADEARFRKCLAELSEAQREALLLRTSSELTYEEIARTVGASLSAVKSLLFRAKEALLACLQGGQHA